MNVPSFLNAYTAGDVLIGIAIVWAAGNITSAINSAQSAIVYQLDGLNSLLSQASHALDEIENNTDALNPSKRTLTQHVAKGFEDHDDDATGERLHWRKKKRFSAYDEDDDL